MIRLRPRVAGGLLGAVLVVAAIAWLSSRGPRAPHNGGAPGPPSPEAPAATPKTRRPLKLPGAPALVGPAAAPAVSPVAALQPGRRVPLPDAAGRIRVPIIDRSPRRLPAEGVPTGWFLREFSGRAVVEVTRGDPGLAVRLRSTETSFVLYRDVIVDLSEFPILTWRWKVARLPAAGDVRSPATDDQAAQVYVVFPRWPTPLTNSDVIGYLWDSRAPVGSRLTSPKASNVKVIVVESGMAKLGSWQRQRRDVSEDYGALFGRPAPRAGQVAVMIDTNDTRGEAEAFFSDIVFSRARSE